MYEIENKGGTCTVKTVQIIYGTSAKNGVIIWERELKEVIPEGHLLDYDIQRSEILNGIRSLGVNQKKNSFLWINCKTAERRNHFKMIEINENILPEEKRPNQRMRNWSYSANYFLGFKHYIPSHVIRNSRKI